MASITGKKARVRDFFKFVRDNTDNPSKIKKELNVLLSEDLDLNVQAYNGYTLLHLVVRLDEVELIKIFHENGVNIEVASVNSETPFLYSILKNKFDSMKTLIELGCDLTASGNYEVNALHLCVENNRIKMLEYILEKGLNVDMPDEFNKTALLLAFERENFDAIKLLVKHGASLYTNDYEGNTIRSIVESRKNEQLKKLYEELMEAS